MDLQSSPAHPADQEDIDNVEISDYEDALEEEVLPVAVSSRFAARPTTAEEVLNKIEALLLQSKIEARESRQEKTKDRRHGKNREAEEDATLLQDELVETAPAGHITQPVIFKGEMRDYQIEALNWMVNLHDNGLNGILADEMGLGKTCETISLLSYLRESRNINGKHLIIVPKSTITNWQREITRFCPDFKIVVLGGSKADREEQKLRISTSDIIITTYEVVIIERAVLRFVKFEYLIIDEAHRIKNETSKLSLVVRQLKSKHRLLITGTPLQNNLHELWALLNFLKPNIFKASQDFQLLFQVPEFKPEDDHQTEAERNAISQDVVIKRLHRILRPFLLRRLKSDVATALPPKIETKLFVGLSAMQRDWYTNLLARDVDALNNSASSNTKTQQLNIMMQLRKVCNHVYLFDGAEPEPFIDGEHLIENSGKMVLLDKLLRKLKKDGSRVLIFSQMTRMLDILEDYCRYREFQYCRIDGSTSQEVRDDNMDKFNAPNSEQFVFLLSTRAGGLGINLQTADTVILYDSDWNPQMDLQAMDRAHRIGQKKQVKVFRFVTEGTVEEKIIERATRKLALDALVVQKGRQLEKEKNVSAQEQQNMVRFGAAYIFSAQGSTVTDEDIDSILQKGSERTLTENEKLQTAKLSLSNFSLTDLDATFNANEFDGVDYSNVKMKLEVPQFVQSTHRRERKMEGSYDVNKYYKQAIYGNTAERKTVMREFKPTQRYDFQFLNEDRIMEIEKVIFEAETRYRHLKYEKRWVDLAKRNMRAHEKILEKRKLIKLLGLNSPLGAERALVFQAQLDEELKIDVDAEEEPVSNTNSTVDEEEEEIDDETLRLQAEFPSEDQYLELETQLNEGYPHWKRTDLQRFISVSAEFGRNNQSSISHAIEGKTAEEVVAYHSAFWENYKQVKDSDKMIKNIEKGEAHLQRLENIGQLLKAKMATVKDPFFNLPVTCPAKTTQGYTEAEDRFLLCAIAYHGYGNWEQIKKDLMFNPYFRCNLYMKTRSTTDIRFRCEALVRMLEKERDGGMLQIKKSTDETPTNKRKGADQDADNKTKKKKPVKTEDTK